MLYGEHLNADEAVVQCKCGMPALVEVFDKRQTSCGWCCRKCAYKKRVELRRMEKIARAIVRKEVP